MADRTIMKRLLVLLVILGSSEMLAQVPAEIGIIYYQNGSALQPLIKVKAKVTTGKNSSAEIPGATEDLRLPAGQPHTFRVCGVDPTRYKLYVLKSTKNARTLTLWTVVGKERVLVLNESEIAVTIQTADGNCFSLTPQKTLDLGEYGFSPVDANDVFAFGIGEVRNPKLALKPPVARQGGESQPRSAQEIVPTGIAAESSNIAIRSTPDGAEITVDGKFVGSTPSTVRLDSGDHEITLQKPGFGTWKRTITLRGGGNVTVDATLEKVSQ